MKSPPIIHCFPHLLITAAMACKVLWLRAWATPTLL